MWVKASASLFIRSPGALLTWPAAGERRQTRRLYILSVSMCSVVYTTSAAWVRHCAGLFATRVDEGKTAPARRFPAARLEDWIAGFGRPLTAGQLTAWFRSWPGAAFEGRWDRLAGAWRPRRGHWGVVRTTSWPKARSPLFQQPPVSQDREPGAAHGPVGLCGGWCPWGECVCGGILSFPCGYYRSAAQSFILLKFPAHFALPLPPASPPPAAPCSTTRIH